MYVCTYNNILLLDIVLAWFHTVMVSYIEETGIIQFSLDSIKITSVVQSCPSMLYKIIITIVLIDHSYYFGNISTDYFL